MCICNRGNLLGAFTIERRNHVGGSVERPARRNIMNHTQVACFLAAAKAESFAVAADGVYMTPPTFSRQIASLEQELGFSLFQRGWKNNQLTPAGQIMFEGLSAISMEYNLLLSRALNAASNVAGTLVLGLLEGQLVDPDLRSVLQNFRSRFPGVTVELRRYSFHDMLKALKSAELDAGITLSVELMNHPDMNAIPLYSVGNDMVFATDTFSDSVYAASLRDFADQTFIEIEQSDSPIISGLMLDSCKRAGFIPRICKVKNLKEQITAIELGQGVAAFNQFHQTCNHPGLTHISLPELPAVEFSFAWMKTSGNHALPFLVSEMQRYFQKEEFSDVPLCNE